MYLRHRSPSPVSARSNSWRRPLQQPPKVQHLPTRSPRFQILPAIHLLTASVLSWAPWKAETPQTDRSIRMAFEHSSFDMVRLDWSYPIFKDDYERLWYSIKWRKESHTRGFSHQIHSFCSFSGKRNFSVFLRVVTKFTAFSRKKSISTHPAAWCKNILK